MKVIIGVVTALLATLAYYVYDLIQKRKALRGLPQPPMQNLLLGHLTIADECTKVFPKGAHFHCWADYIQSKYDLPEIFYLDLRPFGELFMFISDPEIAAKYVTTAQSLPKSPAETVVMDKFLGKNNLISLEGGHWKSLRSLFNPGFSATNVMLRAPHMVDATLELIDCLREKARTNEIFPLEEYAARITINIIGKLALDADLNCLKEYHPIAKYFRERVILLGDVNPDFLDLNNLDIFRPLKLWWNARHLNRAIDQQLDQKIRLRAQALRDATSKKVSDTSIIGLALTDYEKQINAQDQAQGGKGTTRITEASQLPSTFRNDLITSLKTFLFAGYDTSSSVIANTSYLLHRYPEVHAKVAAELNTVFPPGVDATAAAIKANPHSLNKLDYLTAVIKESMRILPPASTLRAINPAHPPTHRTITNPKTNTVYPMDLPHCAIYPAVYLIHRNPRFFPHPQHFIPERFLPSQTPFPEAELFTPAGKEAFRPFEKGPRNCIGQELAMVEIKIVLALTVREFDFVLEYPGEEADVRFPIPDSLADEFAETGEYGRAMRQGGKRDRVGGHRCWQRLAGTAKPELSCPGRIYVRG